MTAAQLSAKVSFKTKICTVLTVAIPLVLFLIPTSTNYTSEIRLFLAITVCGILLFAFEITDNIVPSLLLPAAYVMTKLAPGSVVFNFWTGDLPWMIIGAFLIVNIIDRIGLLKRVAYFILIKTGGSYKGVLYGLMAAGIIMNFAIPGNVYIPLIALAFGICVALGLQKTKAGTGIMLASAMGAILPAFIVYSPNLIGVMINITKTTFGIDLSYAQSIFYNAVFYPWCFLMIFVVSKMFKSDVDFQGKTYFKQEYNALGKMSASEGKALGVVLLLVAYLMTNDWHKLGMGWGFVIAACLFYLPGLKIGEKEDIQKVNLGLILFVGACMCIGQVAVLVGMGEIISRLVMPFMQNCGPMALIAMVWSIATGFNFLLTPYAEMATLTVPIVQITTDMGINPYPVILAFYQGLDQVVMPYESFPYLYLFSFGIVAMKDFMKFFGIKLVLNLIYINDELITNERDSPAGQFIGLEAG